MPFSDRKKLAAIVFYSLLVAFCISLFGMFHGFYIFTTAAERADIPPNMPELLRPPLQDSPQPPTTISLNGYTLSKISSYTVTARVLDASGYHFDREGDVSPVDLVLGWGMMADKRVLAKISIGQANRFYFWYTSEYPVPPEQISASSANVHIIPANDRIKKIVKSLHKNQVVTLKGSLVNVTHPDGWLLNTSTNRQDTGPGACEVIYVEDVTIY